MDKNKKSINKRDCFVVPPRKDDLLKGDEDICKRDDLKDVVIAKLGLCELKQSEFAKGDCFPEESGQAVVPLRVLGAGSRNDDLPKGNDDNRKCSDDLLKRNEGKTENFKLKTANCLKTPPFLNTLSNKRLLFFLVHRHFLNRKFDLLVYLH